MAAATSHSPNIVKILINYSEYIRLKDIEEKYSHLQKKYKDKLHISEGKKAMKYQFNLFDFISFPKFYPFLSELKGNGDDIENSDSEDSILSDDVIFENKKRKLNNDSKEKKSFLFGAGSSEDAVINKIVNLVTEKLKSSEQKTGRGSDLSPPTAELVQNNEEAPLPFNNTITKNDDNDIFGKNNKNFT
jgi:hypothetical protein